MTNNDIDVSIDFQSRERDYVCIHMAKDGSTIFVWSGANLRGSMSAMLSPELYTVLRKIEEDEDKGPQ